MKHGKPSLPPACVLVHVHKHCDSRTFFCNARCLLSGPLSACRVPTTINWYNQSAAHRARTQAELRERFNLSVVALIDGSGSTPSSTSPRNAAFRQAAQAVRFAQPCCAHPFVLSRSRSANSVHCSEISLLVIPAAPAASCSCIRYHTHHWEPRIVPSAIASMVDSSQCSHPAMVSVVFALFVLVSIPLGYCDGAVTAGELEQAPLSSTTAAPCYVSQEPSFPRANSSAVPLGNTTSSSPGKKWYRSERVEIIVACMMGGVIVLVLVACLVCFVNSPELVHQSKSPTVSRADSRRRRRVNVCQVCIRGEYRRAGPQRRRLCSAVGCSGVAPSVSSCGAVSAFGKCKQPMPNTT